LNVTSNAKWPPECLLPKTNEKVSD